MPSTSVLTSRSRRRTRRPPLDRTARRYFVYWLFDATGNCLYIGRSCNVRARLKIHHTDTDWFAQTRSVKMEGPLTWDEAVRLEGTATRAAQPPNNVVYTPRFLKTPTDAQG